VHAHSSINRDACASTHLLPTLLLLLLACLLLLLLLLLLRTCTLCIRRRLPDCILRTQQSLFENGRSQGITWRFLRTSIQWSESFFAIWQELSDAPKFDDPLQVSRIAFHRMLQFGSDNIVF
jgi:hypothetical protein